MHDPAFVESNGVGSASSFSTEAREDFRDAIVRHRRSAWHVTAACAVAYTVLGCVVAVLMAPLLYGVLGLALDVLNHLVPTPNLLGFAGRQLDSLIDPHGPVRPLHVAAVAVLAALPGLCVVAVAALALRRALLRSPLFDAAPPLGRPADPGRLAERQLSNTVAEMAIAAGIPPPRVVFFDGSMNAASFGVDAAHATVWIGADMGNVLTRSQMQGVAGHLVASIAGGDGAIGLRTALAVGLFSLVARIVVAWNEPDRLASLLRLMRPLVLPTAANLDQLLQQLADPFRHSPASDGARVPARSADERYNWRDALALPLTGPLLMTGFLGGLVNTMMLRPLVSLAWRQRKYMADATSVQLTRDPDALDGALVAIVRANAPLRIDSWAAHLCIEDPGTSGNAGLLGKSYVSIFPPGDRRQRALVRLGATDHRDPNAPSTAMPLPYKILLAVLLTVVGILLSIVTVGLIYLSAAMSGLFTVLPIAALHALLR